MERFENINEYKRGCEANYDEFVTTHEAAFFGSLLSAKAWTTGYHGGDTGHGSHTLFRIARTGSADMKVTTNEDQDMVEVELGGDWELSTIIDALDFISTVLRHEADKSKQVESGYVAPELVEGYTSYIKLSAYEDTGLEPAEIEKLKADCKELEELFLDSDRCLRAANTKLHKIEEVLADGGN